MIFKGEMAGGRERVTTDEELVRALWLPTRKKRRSQSKACSLSPLYDFTPIAVETLGAIGKSAMDFFRQLVQCFHVLFVYFVCVCFRKCTVIK